MEGVISGIDRGVTKSLSYVFGCLMFRDAFKGATDQRSG